MASSRIKAPSPRRVEREMSRLDQLRAELGDKFDLDSVESETNALEIIDDYAELILGTEAVAALAAERSRRLRARAANWRATVVQIIEQKLPPETGKLERPLATISVSYRQKLVLEEDQLPAEYFTLIPDKKAIEQALRQHSDAVPGASWGNLEPHLIVRPMKPGEAESEETGDE